MLLAAANKGCLYAWRELTFRVVMTHSTLIYAELMTTIPLGKKNLIISYREYMSLL